VPGIHVFWGRTAPEHRQAEATPSFGKSGDNKRVASPHQRRATNKAAPRFKRNHGELVAFGGRSAIALEWSVIMPTIQEEKAAKRRARNRKADQRSSKGGQKQAEARAEVDAASPMVAEPEVAETEIAETEVAAVEAAPDVAIEPVVRLQESEQTALTGEVLPPEVVRPASHVDGFQAMAQAYGEYTKKSWLNGRFLMERLIAARTFDEAIEIQGEFAKQTYANFLTQSERMCVLYGEWAQQFFRPLVWRL
jgi:hypothetical protein